MNKKTIVGTMFSALILNGCGGGGADFIDISALKVGTWSNGCQSDLDFGDSSLGELDFNNTSGTVYSADYDSINCSGTAETSTVDFTISYPGEVSVPGYYNCQKVNFSIQYPVYINGTTYDENQYALLAEEDQPLDVNDIYDIVCTNEAGTVLYFGDEETGDGTSDATRPTSIDALFSIDLLQS